MHRNILSGSVVTPICCNRGNPFPTPEEIIRAGIEALRLNVGYTDPLGIIELRQSIAACLSEQLAVSYLPKTEIIVTAGASSAIFTAISAITDPGDEVLVPNPGWPAYLRMIEILGRHAIPYTISPFQVMDAAASGVNPKAIIVNSPHNPTGTVLDRDDLQQIEAIHAAYPHLTIISDETYEALIFDSRVHISPASLPDLTPVTVVVRSFSKTYSMPGWRVGYLAAPEPLTAKIRPLHTAMNSISPTISQYAALWALDHGASIPGRLCARYESNRNYLAARLGELSGFSCEPSQGGMYLFPALSGNTCVAADVLARRYGVYLYPGEIFGSLGKGHVRICLALETDVLQELCHRIIRFTEEY